MIIQVRDLATDAVTTLQSDICIVGTGPAGLAIADSLRDHTDRLLLVDSGGRRPSETRSLLNQALCDGQTLDPMKSRVRVLGGTSSVWGGRCIAMEASDFETNWPFSIDEIRPWYQEARSFCGLPEPPELPRALTDRLEGSGLCGRWMQRRAQRFGSASLAWIRRSRRLQLLLDTTVIHIQLNPSGTGVSELHAVAPGDRSLLIKARLFVLATGGIENPRLLLSSRDVHRQGIGNAHANVGCFFSDHPYQSTAHIEPLPHPNPVIATRHNDHALLVFSEATHRSRGVLKCAGYIEPITDYTQKTSYSRKSVIDARELLSQMRGRIPPKPTAPILKSILKDVPALAQIGLARARATFLPPRAGLLRLVAAPRPRRESCVQLSTEKDPLGVPIPIVRWALAASDLGCFELFTRLFRESWSKSYPDSTVKDLHDIHTDSGNHHMGATRMHRDPARGVVDENCRVHGVENLYIAGSSMFPSFGYANPTLTLIALARRLAAHLKAASKAPR